MLCDKIMDLSHVTLTAIISVFLVGTSEETSWGSTQLDRHNGYDLQRGPVFYEGFYSDDQDPAAMEHQRSLIHSQSGRRYFDHVSTLKRTYQAVEDSQNAPLHETNPRILAQGQLISGDYKVASISPKSIYSSVETSRNPSNLRSGSDDAYEVTRQLKRFVEDLEKDPDPRNYLNTREFEDPRRSYGSAATGRNFRTSNPYWPTIFETAYRNERFDSDRRLNNYMNIILSAVKKEALELSKEHHPGISLTSDNTEGNGRVSRQQRFVNLKDSFDRPQQKVIQFGGNYNTIAQTVKAGDTFSGIESEERRRFLGNGGYLDQNNKFNIRKAYGDEYHDVRGPITDMRFPHMENIFQPRPQVISYVFSPSKTQAKGLQLTVDRYSESTERKLASLNDEPENYGDNLIQKEMRKEVKKSDGLGIASIEVSKVPRHKIRHHHGEKSKRNHDRHTTTKADQ